jgi:cell division protein FtsL
MSQQINLFNPIYMKQRKYFSLLTMLQALGMIVAGSLLFYGYAIYQVGQLKRQADQNNNRYVAEQARLTAFMAEYSPQHAMQSLQNEVQDMGKQVAEQSRIIETLKSGAIGNTTGYSEYMRAFSRQVVHGLWLTGFKVTGDAAQISLSGGVVNPQLLPIYIQHLGRESIMKGKTFATLQMKQSDADKADGKSSKAANSARRYIEFTLYSSPGKEADK